MASAPHLCTGTLLQELFRPSSDDLAVVLKRHTEDGRQLVDIKQQLCARRVLGQSNLKCEVSIRVGEDNIIC